MIWVFLIINVIWACFAIYQMIKANKENGLFDYTVFQMYLKEKGLSDEEIEVELDKRARLHNELFDAIGFEAMTENKYRAKIAEYRKKHNLK